MLDIFTCTSWKFEGKESGETPYNKSGYVPGFGCEYHIPVYMVISLLLMSTIYAKYNRKRKWKSRADTVIWGDFGLLGWLRKFSLNWNISMTIASFFQFFSDSAPHHSDVSLGINIKFMKVSRFEEEQRMCDILSVRIKQPILTKLILYYFDICFYM